MFALNSLGLQIKAHWKEHRPKMAAALEKAGKLQEAVYAAQELTGQAMYELLEKGVPPDQAREAVREEWAFLPTEEDQPSLTFQPENLSLLLTPPTSGPTPTTTGSPTPTK